MFTCVFHWFHMTTAASHSNPMDMNLFTVAHGPGSKHSWQPMVGPLEFFRQLTLGHLIFDGCQKPIDIFRCVVCSFPCHVSLTHRMLVLTRTPTWQVHVLSNPSVSSHKFPALFHEIPFPMVSQIDLASMNNRSEKTIFLLQVLHDG